MDRLNPGVEYGNDNLRSSQDPPRRERQTPKLQKKASAGGRLSRPYQQNRTEGQLHSFDVRRSGIVDEGCDDRPGQRKSSLRNVVRRIFGRTSSRSPAPPEPEQVEQRSSPPRHTYHHSEPPQLHVPRDETLYEGHLAPHRTLSAPLQITPTPAFASRARSPYAVEFPNSARLKPLNLGNPLPASGKQLKRRKTLPSVLIADRDAAKLKKAINSPTKSPLSPMSIAEDAPITEPARSAAAKRRSRRRSRSVGNLKRNSPPNMPRKRSEEIRYWRESMHGSVLRASGFTSQRYSQMYGTQEDNALRPPSARKEDDEVTPTAQIPDPFTTKAVPTAPVGNSPRSQRADFNQADARSPFSIGTEMSQDLEDRVARLEAGLQNFQRSLQRMTAKSNRKTVILGGVPGTANRTSTGTARTPSMLADTLFDPFGAPNYNSESSESQRPRTSPTEEPKTPMRAETSRSRAPPVPPIDTAFDRLGEPNRTPAPPLQTRTMSYDTDNDLPTHNQVSNNDRDAEDPPELLPHTFRSLYQMLATERSERRKLNAQIRNMRLEITDLQYQAQTWSNVQSNRSSAHLTNTTGSARLQQVLNQASEEDGGPERRDFGGAGLAQRSYFRDSATTAGTSSSLEPGQAFVSRFSGSESLAGSSARLADGAVDEEEIATPYEAYQTPAEERGEHFRFPAANGVREGEMF